MSARIINSSGRSSQFIPLGSLKIAWICAGLSALVSGCAGYRSIPVPTPKYVEYANRNGQATSLAAMNLGRKLYIRRCSDCHRLKRPESLDAEDWPEMVDRMTQNAKLNPDQKRAITQYLVGVSAAAHDTSAAASAPPSPPAPAPTAPRTGVLPSGGP